MVCTDNYMRIYTSSCAKMVRVSKSGVSVCQLCGQLGRKSMQGEHQWKRKGRKGRKISFEEASEFRLRRLK